jgi:type IV pilus assembly protein PilX
MMTQHNQQTGAALIVSLVMLLLLTIVGVSSVRMTSMQERMAGNLQFRTTAFERAEEAARFGEDEALSFGDGATFNDTNGLYETSGTDGLPRWRDVDTNWRGDANLKGEYILEQIGEVPRDPSCQLNAASTCFSMLYRVTARAEVDNTGAGVMVQSTYKAP